MEKLNVAIADDNERMVQLLDEIVASDKDLQVVGTAKNGVEAYEIIKHKQPDVVLLDIVMPKLDGLALLEKVKKEIGRGALIQRYKGLGEMNPDQLWDTTLNPETRTLFQVTIEDAAKAEKMVSLLMGDVVEPRKNYMYKYAEF